MRFDQKLKSQQFEAIWQEYCGFLDLDIFEYMQIQNRLMQEQIAMWSDCELGKQLLHGCSPKTFEEFLHALPLTTYADYADVLLQKKVEMLPDEPLIWIQTTWEGGKHPIKNAPYTKGMIDTFRNNVITCMILSTSTERGKFNVQENDKILYGLAPLPYATGLLPLVLNQEITIDFLPAVKDAINMSFSERNVEGFKLGLSKGIDFFFGLGSVAYYISLNLTSMGSKSSSKKSMLSYSLPTIFRLLRAQYRCKRENRQIKPKDLFKLKGFMCAGTDNNCYKDDLEDLWGIRPLEMFAGTEPSCVGTEIWSRNGMYFFPDSCFYEFIPEDEMLKSLEDNEYQPKTCFMDEVISGEKYELVVSVLKGGAFMRYRVGDVYRCIGLDCSEDKIRIPRFEYIDRTPSIIDIGGFTRITEDSINNVIKLSGLNVEKWVAAKEYSAGNRPFLHLYVELSAHAMTSTVVSREILKDHLTPYFKHIDGDYKDLIKILGIDPLEVTIIRCGTFAKYRELKGKGIRPVNPSIHNIRELIHLQEVPSKLGRWNKSI